MLYKNYVVATTGGPVLVSPSLADAPAERVFDKPARRVPLAQPVPEVGRVEPPAAPERIHMPSILYCTITVKRAGARAQRAAAITRRQGIVQILRASENRELSSGELAEDACRAEPLLRKHSKLLPRRPPIRPPPSPAVEPVPCMPGPKHPRL